MRIGDAAAAAETTPRALRFYEQRGLLDPPRTATGQRWYRPVDVHRVRLIRHMLDLGLTVQDVESAVDVLDRYGGEPPPTGREAIENAPDEGVLDRAGEVLHQRINALDEQIDRLTRLRGDLAECAVAVSRR